jgi:two-component system phosphate regulon sensor histidine kinase PhoR
MGIIRINNQIHFFVKDTGIGIPEKEIDKIFERFYRGSNVAKSTIGGTGPGLSIVKEMIELLGGKIWVESELGQGSTFYFSINSNTE